MRPKNGTFRKACHSYNRYKDLHQKLTVNNRYLFDERAAAVLTFSPDKYDAFRADQQIAKFERKLLEENINYVDDTFKKIEEQVEKDRPNFSKKDRNLDIVGMIHDNYVEGVCLTGIEETARVPKRKIITSIMTYVEKADANKFRRL